MKSDFTLGRPADGARWWQLMRLGSAWGRPLRDL